MTDRRPDLTSRRPGQGHGRGPLRWRLAGRLAANLPEVRGRDRVVGWAQGSTDEYAGPLRGRFVNGMLFDVDSSRDGSARELSALRYRPPALAPVFAAVLGPGDCCYDVGANIGVYTLWAAGLVGSSGQVHAFEPVPDTMAVLEAMVRRNGLSQVRLESCAVGATVGEIGMRVYRDASGLAHPVTDIGSADRVASLTTLDAHTERHGPLISSRSMSRASRSTYCVAPRTCSSPGRRRYCWRCCPGTWPARAEARRNWSPGSPSSAT